MGFGIKNTEQEFWLRVAPPDANGCRTWTGGRDRYGYGKISWNGKRVKTHRLAWMLANDAEIPPRTLVCHTCDNPLCCEPGHLFLGTNDDNIKDKVSKGRQQRGETHKAAKLSNAQVEEIIRRYKHGEASQTQLAQEFGVSQMQISNITSGKNRRDVWSRIISLLSADKERDG